MNYNAKDILDNTLQIGGCSVKELVKTYKTPLYVYDEDHIVSQMNIFKTYTKSNFFHTETAYASKAFLNKTMVQLVYDNNLMIDCVSSGELYIVKHSGFDMGKVLFHGNNKTNEELKMALRYQVGTIVVDHIQELNKLIILANRMEQTVDILLRVNPRVRASTHEYIITASPASKFGIDLSFRM